MATRKTMGGMSEDMQYQAESDLRTMIECEKIEADPKRLKAVRDLAKEKTFMLASIASESEGMSE